MWPEKKEVIFAKALPANTTEDYEISYASDKPEIAKVDGNGTVTGISEGEAVITVTLVANPDNSDEGEVSSDTRTYTTTVDVSVEAAPALPQGAYTYNVTESGIKSNDVYTLKGNLKTKLNCTYGGLTLTQGIKMESTSKTQIDLNAGEKGTWVVITDPTCVGKKVNVAGTGYTVSKGDGDYGIVEHVISTPGVYSIVKSDSNVYIMYMDLLTEGGSGDTDAAVTGITVAPANLFLGIDDSAVLTATIAPENATNKKINWSTSDPLVATVKDGVVTAVGAGKAVITARSVANADYSATCEVTVEAGIETVPVTGISLDTDKDFELGVGKVKTLKATVTPENATDKIVTWSSSNEGVAKVEDGVVTGISDGEAVITAFAGDKSVAVKVTVKSDSKEGDEPSDPSKPDDPVNSTVSMAKVPIYIGDKTYTLSYTKSYQYTGDKILLTDINIDGAKVGETIPGTQVTFAKIKYKNNKARGTASANIVLKANKGADKNLKNMVKFSNAVSKANPIAFEIIPRTLTADKVAGTAVYNAKKGKWKMKLTVDVGGKKPLKLKLNKKADKTDFGVDTAFAPQTDGSYPATVNITGVNNFNGTVPVSVTVK
ncbi:MAG: Ig-like domain-containing protein [Lachnospiraceae bacterium]|nr:Ig-like domain-containing protein [Lachnospiraceae bacterium]